MELLYTKKNLVYALTARERFDIFKKNSHIITTDNLNIKEWRKIKNLSSESSFNKKLYYESFSKEEYNYAIKKLNEEDKNQLFKFIEDSEWYNIFLEIMNTLDNEKTFTQYDLSFIIRPFIFYSSGILKMFIKNIKNINLDIEILLKAIDEHNVQLVNIFSKVFIIELELQKNKGQLKGETKEERYEFFLKTFFTTKGDLLNFYFKYPTLIRMAIVRTKYFLDFITETIQRLDENFIDIKNKFYINTDVNSIKDINIGLGDSHQKSKTVIIFELSDNTKIVYKARNLKFTEHYNKFITYINNKYNLLDLPLIEGLYFNDFAFEKFVEHKECTNDQELVRFYKRFGQLVGLSYVLCGNDFHLENLIAAGEHPVIIDLETFIQPIVPLELIDKASIIAKNHIYNNTIVSTALLPFIAFNNNAENIGIDISALDGKETKLPFKVLLLTNANTDEVRYEYKEYVRKGAHNLPQLNGKSVNYKSYAQNIIQGFEDLIMCIINDKENLLSENGALSIFKDVHIRSVIKSTNRYVSLLKYSNHPNYATDMLKKEKLLENMWAYPYKNKEVVRHETIDMLFNDVPIFFTNSNSKNIITSDNVIIEDFFVQSGYDRVLEKVKNLDEVELLEQKSYMIVCLGLYDEYQKRLVGTKTMGTTENIQIDYIKEAVLIADNILKKAFYSDNDKEIAFVDVIKKSPNNMLEISVIGGDFYDGLAGIAFFFYELYKVSNIDKYYDAYKKIINNAITELEISKEIGAYKGRISLVFPILNQYLHTGSSEYFYCIDRAFTDIEENLDNINELDWFNGFSGIIVTILDIYNVSKDNKYINLAIKLGEKLKNKININCLSNIGMINGCSEIALSLFKLGDCSYDKSYTKLAIKIINKEREYFDFKELSFDGITRLGIFKLEIMKYYVDSTLENEIKNIVYYTINTIKNNDCLSKGNMADIELLLLYKKRFNDSSINNIINNKISYIFNMKENNNEYNIQAIPCFTCINLFKGLSGIGYQLLRIYSSDKVSNALTLTLT